MEESELYELARVLESLCDRYEGDAPHLVAAVRARLGSDANLASEDERGIQSDVDEKMAMPRSISLQERVLDSLTFLRAFAFRAGSSDYAVAQREFMEATASPDTPAVDLVFQDEQRRRTLDSILIGDSSSAEDELRHRLDNLQERVGDHHNRSAFGWED